MFALIIFSLFLWYIPHSYNYVHQSPYSLHVDLPCSYNKWQYTMSKRKSLEIYWHRTQSHIYYIMYTKGQSVSTSHITSSDINNSFIYVSVSTEMWRRLCTAKKNDVGRMKANYYPCESRKWDEITYPPLISNQIRKEVKISLTMQSISH